MLASLAYDSSRPPYSCAMADWIREENRGGAVGLTLDVGCGTGRSSRWARTFSDQVVGIDSSAEMIAIAQRVNDDPAVSFREVPAEQAGTGTAPADLVLCASAFEWFDKAKFATQARNVLRPSAPGVVIIWSWLEPLDPVTGQWYRLMRRVLGAQAGPDANDAMAMAASFFPQRPRHQTVRVSHAYGLAELSMFIHSSSYWRDGRPERTLDVTNRITGYLERFGDADGTARLVFREVAFMGRLA